MSGRDKCFRGTGEWVAFLAIASGLSAAPAAAGLMDIQKNMTFTLPAGAFLTATGQGKVFGTADSNAVQVFDNPPSTFFKLSAVADSLPTITANAQIGDYRGFASAMAGKTTTVGQNVTVPVVIRARAQWPDTPPPNGGFAVGISTVKIRGATTTVDSITVNGLKVAGGAQANRLINEAKDKGAVVLDPIHFSAQDLLTGETIDADVYSNQYTARGGGGVGFNTSGLLELSIPDVPDPSALAEFSSSTLVPFATDLTGLARLEGGALTATGIFYPDTSRPITDFWSLTFSPTDPTFIDDAIFLASSQFSEIAITPSFTGPGTNATDPVEVAFEVSLRAQESATDRPLVVPEPGSLALFGLAFAAWVGSRGRRRLRAA